MTEEATALTPELARRSPVEYTARYLRLHSLERVRHVEGLDDDGLLAHLDAFLGEVCRGARLLRFHVVVSLPAIGARVPVRYGVALEGESYDRPLGELEVTPARLARLRAWMLARSPEPPWFVVRHRAHGRAASLDDRLDPMTRLLDDARVVEILLGLAEPWSERGEAPHGTIALAVRLVAPASVNVVAVLRLDDDVCTDAYAIQAADARRWANDAAARWGVPCRAPSALLWSRLRG